MNTKSLAFGALLGCGLACCCATGVNAANTEVRSIVKTELEEAGYRQVIGGAYPIFVKRNIAWKCLGNQEMLEKSLLLDPYCVSVRGLILEPNTFLMLADEFIKAERVKNLNNFVQFVWNGIYIDDANILLWGPLYDNAKDLDISQAIFLAPEINYNFLEMLCDGLRNVAPEAVEAATSALEDGNFKQAAAELIKVQDNIKEEMVDDRLANQYNNWENAIRSNIVIDQEWGTPDKKTLEYIKSAKDNKEKLFYVKWALDAIASSPVASLQLESDIIKLNLKRDSNLECSVKMLLVPGDELALLAEASSESIGLMAEATLYNGFSQGQIRIDADVIICQKKEKLRRIGHGFDDRTKINTVFEILSDEEIKQLLDGSNDIHSEEAFAKGVAKARRAVENGLR